MHWEELENLLTRSTKDADKLSDLFVKVSSDLSYARTFFPNRSVRLYLNNLTQRVFDSMRTDEDKFSFKQITNFFAHILPQEIYNSRKALLTSFLVFVLALFIGVVSSKYHEDFERSILGSGYIEMTERNIADGDPMAVYKDERKLDMFFGITTNNIRVAMLAFVLGIIGSVGTIVVLLSNGIMVGAFQYFFYSKGLFWTSFLTIWIHGTIEISAIIIAGGAGIVLGNGLLFPKTYDRSTSLQVAALRALRIILGTVPLFLIAGLLESFVTRQTELPTIIKALIIGLSAILILGMWVIYPWYYHKMGLGEKLTYEIAPQHSDKRQVDKIKHKNFAAIVSDSFYEFRTHTTAVLRHALLPTLMIIIALSIVQLKISNYNSTELRDIELYSLAKLSIGGIISSLIYLTLMSYAFSMVSFLLTEIKPSLQNKLKFLKKNFLQIAVVTALMYLPYALINSYYWLFFWLIFPPHFYVIAIEKITNGNDSIWINFKDAFALSINKWFKFFALYLIGLFMMWVVILFQSSILTSLVTDFISWHNLFDIPSKNIAFVSTIISWIMFIAFAPGAYYFFKNQYYSIVTEVDALDLNIKLKSFGNTNSIFEKS